MDKSTLPRASRTIDFCRAVIVGIGHSLPSMPSRDLTLTVYGQLLEALKGADHRFQTFSEFVRAPAEHAIMLRHDVDDRKLHSLAFARLQHQRGIVGTYYFRMLPQSFDQRVVREIHELGHEIGYHYEEMDLCRGDVDRAFDLFRRNLERLRNEVPVTSICMHGSPLSRFDNKDLWKRNDYRSLGIVGEPYLDLDFERVAYFTDTGGRWDGDRYSVRDRAASASIHRFRSTQEIARAVRHGDFPSPAMLTFHPQRWTGSAPLWLRDRIVQHAKNYAKFGIIQWRSLRESRK